MTNILRAGQIAPPLLQPTLAARTGSRTLCAGRIALGYSLKAPYANATLAETSFEFVTGAAVFSTCPVSGPDVVFERRRCDRRRKRQVQKIQ
jgi:hypothetical protein